MRFKDGLKKAVKTTLSALPRGPRTDSTHAQPSRVLTYHSVGDRDHGMNVEPQAFAEQMQCLSDHYAVISVGDAVKGEGGIAITFDDGYRDNLINAAPVLSRLGLPATVFIVTGKLGQMLDHDNDFKSSVLMTWEEVSQLEGMGMEIGAHTVNHLRLSSLAPEDQRTEILESAQAITQHLGHKPVAFAYPYGSSLDFDASSQAIVKESGFEFAFSNRYGVIAPGADTWSLRRIWIDRSDSLELFRAKVEGKLDALSLLDSGPGIHARKLLNLMTGG